MNTKPPNTESTATGRKHRMQRSALLGAVFLMATSAIGPGFITQTADFTARLGAAFAFAITLSVVVDIAIQLNVWRVIGVSGQRAQTLGNELIPGLGWLLAGLVFLGGLVFNTGNVAGSGVGMNAMFGLDPIIGGIITGAIAIAIFFIRQAGALLDRVVVLLGVVMILLTLYVAVVSNPPVGDALKNAVWPFDASDSSAVFLAATTLIGGTVGGYITYAGAHRMLDSGKTGPQYVKEVSRSSVTGILVTAAMRILLFLAILGVVASGAQILAQGKNPAALAFEFAAGDFGLRIFGVVLWVAAITSVIGAAYTSISFVTTAKTSESRKNLMTAGFIAVSTVIFAVLRQTPTDLLVFAGAFNGLILPIGFAVVLWIAWFRRDLLHGYHYPRWLLVIGTLAWLLTIYLAVNSFTPLLQRFFPGAL